MAKNRIEKAYDILKSYKGTNNQILYLKHCYEKGSLVLEDFDVNYILNNYDFEEIKLNKIVEITNNQGIYLRDKFSLEFVPEKLFISRIIGEMGGSYHVYAQYRKTVPLQLMYLKKNGIITEFEHKDYKETVVDFEKFNSKTKNIGRKILPHQEEGVKFLLTNRKSILADSMGLGKAQPVNTVIPTPYGNKKIGDLKIGDYVFSSDGKKHRVLGVYPQGRKQTYRLIFNDGTETICCEDHLMILRNFLENETEWSVKSVKEIFENGWKYLSKGAKYYTKPCFEIPFTKPLDYDKVEHYIDPYIIGLYIGDTSDYALFDPANISFPRPAVKFKAEVNRLLKDDYHMWKHKWNCLYFTNRIWSDSKGDVEGANDFSNEITRLGLNAYRDYRYIPDEYIFDSKENRLALLQGMMDARGKFGRMGFTFQFRTLSEKLANQFIDLVRSLGGFAKLRIRTISRPKRRGTTIEYKCIFNILDNPFRIKEQSIRFHNGARRFTEYRKILKDVKKTSVFDCVCIKVDSPDESYITNDYIVTHNTTTSIVASLAGGYEHILVITTANLKTQWKKEISLYADEKDIEIVSGSKWTPGKKFTVINYDIISNFYEVPMEIEYQTFKTDNGRTLFKLDENGEKIPEWVVDKKTGELIPKMVKSRKKKVIEESMKNSPLYLDNYDCIIIDECHKLSNNKSIRYKTISDFIVKSCPKAIYLLTGTPITKDTSKFYNVLKLIKHPVTADYNYYMNEFCGAKTFKRNGKEILIPTASTNLDELKKKIQNSYIRRVFSDLPNMPDKTVIEKEYDLNTQQQLTYDRLWDEYMESQNSIDPNNNSDEYRMLIEGGIVRRYLALEMVQNTINIVDSEIENGEKVIIMCNYVDELNAFKDYYKDKCVVYDGTNTATVKKKDKARDRFLNDPTCQVFVGNITSASVGLNLDVSKTLIFNSYSWIAADNLQAEDRIYRVSQKRNCRVVYMLWTDSISKEMFDKVMIKKIVANSVIKKESEK